MIMEKLFLLIFSFFFLFVCSEAQKPEYHSVNNLTMMAGSAGPAPAIQTIHGLKKGKWYYGIGAGVDYYRYRTLPLFADIRMDFGKRNNLFVYADAGLNIAWVQAYFIDRPSIWNNNRSNNFRSGYYSDAGMGIRFPVIKKQFLVISTGYSVKQFSEISTHRDWRSQELFTTRNSYRLGRINLKAGWEF